MKKSLFVQGIICCLIIWTAFETFAAPHALLIGISEYPGLPSGGQLEGPAYDIDALKALLETAGFSENQITILKNKQASRKNILSAMKSLRNATSSGDFILIYFSGHGTSVYNRPDREWGMDLFTGGLLPADFENTNDISQMMKKLIIGKRDIRPILETVEKDREVLAVFDACYSGETVRSFPGSHEKKVRYTDLGLAELIDDDEPAEYDDNNTAKAPPYPYQNVVYISAASKREQAVDITSLNIQGGMKTIDGKPHGAMTNALLRAFQTSDEDKGNTRRPGDGNGDGNITYDELYQYVRTYVSEKFGHTPHMLYHEKNQKLLKQTVFRGSLNSSQESEPHQKILTVRMKNLEKSLEEKIAAISGLKIADDSYDILVIRTQDEYRMYLANDTMLGTVPHTEPDELVRRLSRQVQVRELIHLSYPHQNFNVFLEMTGQNGVMTQGDVAGFVIRTDADSHILLINIDPAGLVNVIYPCKASEFAVRKAGEPLPLPEIAEIMPPNFGIEYIKVFAFGQQPSALKRFQCMEDLSPFSADFGKLMKMVRTPETDAAQATLRMKTCARKDIQR